MGTSEAPTLMGYPMVEGNYVGCFALSPTAFDMAAEQGLIEVVAPGRATVYVPDLFGVALVIRSGFVPAAPDS